MRRLHGNVGYVGAWVKFLRGLRGSKYFLLGSTFYVGHNFYVGCVGQYFYVGQHFLCVLKFFCDGLNFCVGQFFVVGLKNIDWRFHNNILVFYYIRIENTLNQHPISCNFSFT